MEINTYPQCIRCRSNLGHILQEKVRLMVQNIWYLPLAHKTQVKFRSHFSGKKSVSYGPRNTVLRTCELWPQTHYPSHHQLYFWRTCSGGICIPAVCVIILRWILPERRNCWQFLLHKFIKGVYSFGRFRKKCWQDTWSFEKKKKLHSLITAKLCCRTTRGI